MSLKTVNIPTVYGVPVTVNLIVPKGKANVRRLVKIKTPLYIAVHNTANTAKTADDILHGRYLQNLENADKEYKSWHFTVDEDSITQHLPLDEQGYHAGDGAGKGNSNSIAIEICENGDYAKAEENAIKLIIWLMKNLNIGINYVKPHYFFSGKICPRNIIKSSKTADADWAKFTARITSTSNSLNGVTPSTPTTPSTPAPTPSKATISVGDSVTVRPSALKWATGQTIPNWVKGQKYRVSKVDSDKVLLENILSWIFIKDVIGDKLILSIGSKVRVKPSAFKWSTGQTIPNWVKGQDYTIRQVDGSKVLLNGVLSWIGVADIDIVS